MQEDNPKVEQVLCMNGGRGANSYAKNSSFQRSVMGGASHILEQSVKEICATFSSTKCLTIADLGCATGPNALLAVTKIVNIVSKIWSHNTTPSFFVLLNDLPTNDFNTIFRSQPNFYDQLRQDGRECFVAAVPGSFYGRLFPSRIIHFVHLSYALHWLSQVPDGLIGANGEALNKGNICIGEASSLNARKEYHKQFKKDFRAFLSARYEELMPGGNMVLTFCGNPIGNDSFKCFEVIGLTLGDLAKQGLIKESELDEFNLPTHAASEEEIKKVILDEGNFTIRKIEIVKTPWEGGMEEDDMSTSRGEFVAKYLRAVLEPQLSVVFGECVMDELFRRASVRFNDLMNVEVCYFHNIVVWLTSNHSTHL